MNYLIDVSDKSRVFKPRNLYKLHNLCFDGLQAGMKLIQAGYMLASPSKPVDLRTCLKSSDENLDEKMISISLSSCLW